MIEKIDISGSNYKIEESFQKYVVKRLGKLDSFLPRDNRKDVVIKVVVAEVDRAHGNKYEITASLDIPGSKSNDGKVLVAKDETGNVFAGIDILEAKLESQIRRYKTESTNYDKKGFLKRFLKK